MSLLSGIRHYKRKRRLSTALDAVIGSCNEVSQQSRATLKALDHSSEKKITECRKVIEHVCREPAHTLELGKQVKPRPKHFGRRPAKHLKLVKCMRATELRGKALLPGKWHKDCCKQQASADSSQFTKLRLRCVSANNSLASDLLDFSGLPTINVIADV